MSALDRPPESAGAGCASLRHAPRLRRSQWLNRLTIATLVAISVALISGCDPTRIHHPYPETLYRPTIVGVIESGGLGGSLDWRVTLADGRSFDLASEESVPSPAPLAGRLFLRGSTASDGRWWGALPALGDGCWEACGGSDSRPMVWDLGSSILFMDGLELTKAAGFWAEVGPDMVDGRLGWLRVAGDVFAPTSPTTFCANARGEIEFAVLKWTGQRPSSTPRS